MLPLAPTQLLAIDIGSRCSVGSGSAVLYDWVMQVTARPTTRGDDGPALHLAIFDLDDEAHLACFGSIEEVGHDSRIARRRRAIGHAIVRRTLARHLNVEPGDLALCHDLYGRPALTENTLARCGGARPFDFNVAHSEHVLAIGISRSGRIGVDVEVVRAPCPAAALASGCFSSAEAHHLRALPEHQRLAAFYRCWTAKEAFTKALGLGISFGLDRVETEVCDETDSVRIRRVNGSERLAGCWHVEHRTVVVGEADAIVAAVIPGL